jgi:hypothetical protein
MLQKVTASILLWLMAMVVSMAQPGLRYCSCLEEIFFGECCFETELDDGAVDVLVPQTLGKIGEIASSDCSKDLYIAVEHSPANVAQEVRDKVDDVLPPPLSGPPETELPLLFRRVATNATRGPPPASPVVSTVPLYLRHSVFLV